MRRSLVRRSCAALLEPIKIFQPLRKLVRTFHHKTLVLLSPGFGPVALLLDLYFWIPSCPPLRRGNQLLHYLASGLPSQGIFPVFAEDDRIAGDLFHTAVEHLVVLAQEICLLRAVGDHRHHLSGCIFHRALQYQLRNSQAALSAGAVWQRTIHAALANRTHKRISAAVRTVGPGYRLGLLFRLCNGSLLRYFRRRSRSCRLG